MNNKIMAVRTLDNIVLRLDCCAALLQVVRAHLGENDGDAETGDALSGVCDLLRCISNDFQADIETAEEVKRDG